MAKHLAVLSDYIMVELSAESDRGLSKNWKDWIVIQEDRCLNGARKKRFHTVRAHHYSKLNIRQV